MSFPISQKLPFEIFPNANNMLNEHIERLLNYRRKLKIYIQNQRFALSVFLTTCKACHLKRVYKLGYGFDPALTISNIAAAESAEQLRTPSTAAAAEAPVDRRAEAWSQAAQWLPTLRGRATRLQRLHGVSHASHEVESRKRQRWWETAAEAHGWINSQEGHWEQAKQAHIWSHPIRAG